MPSDELIAEIEKAAEEIDINETIDKEEKVAQETADASVQSDEEKAAAEVAEVDDAAAQKVIEDEKFAQESAGEEGAAAEAAGQEIAKNAISDELLERALDVDISMADARSLPLESLERIIEARERTIAAEIEAEERASVDVQSKEAEDPFSDFPKLDPEVHDTDVIKSFEKVMEITKQQYETIQALQRQQEDISLATQAREAAEVEKWFDKQVAGLGEEFSEALGVGDYRSLSQGSSQYANREKIANQLSVLLSGYAAQGLEAPPREELFNTAARLVLHKEYQAIDNKKLASDLEKQASQHIQRASGRQVSSAQSPEDEAAALLDEKFG